jgi:hypothetical protein
MTELRYWFGFCLGIVMFFTFWASFVLGVLAWLLGWPLPVSNDSALKASYVISHGLVLLELKRITHGSKSSS